jgi:hypothetical protein
MPYSKSPESFAQLYYDLLDYALESRARIEVRSQEPQKIISRFYGFCNAWKHRATEAEKMGNFPLAAEHKKRAAALMRYAPRKEKDKAVFLHKDMLSELAGERITASNEKVEDSLLEAAGMFARAQLGVPEPAASVPVVPVAPDNLAKKLFNIDTSKPREFPLAPVPQSEEEKTLMEQIRREMEESGDKHGDET